MARKLAAIRSFYKSMVELGEMTANPADLLPAPKQPQRLPLCGGAAVPSFDSRISYHAETPDPARRWHD